MFSNLQTDRLILRTFNTDDAPRVQELAGDKEVANTTLGIPHPYPIEAAESWINNNSKNMENGTLYPLAIVKRENGILIGTMTLRIDNQHNKGEIAYWIGREYWGNRYATEAAKAIMKFGFNKLDLNRIWAMAMSRNPASSKVMKKVGMKQEGKLIQHIVKSENYEDLDVYGVLKSDFKE